MNSAVGLIFNESFVEKKGLWVREQCMRPTKKALHSWNAHLQIKKKKKEEGIQNIDAGL